MSLLTSAATRFVESSLSFFRMRWDHEPPQRVGRGVLTAPRPGGLGTARPTLGFMEREHLQNLDVSWGNEPGRRLQSGTGFQPVSPEQAGCLCHFLRFMGSRAILGAHEDHGGARLRRALISN